MATRPTSLAKALPAGVAARTHSRAMPTPSAGPGRLGTRGGRRTVEAGAFSGLLVLAVFVWVFVVVCFRGGGVPRGLGSREERGVRTRMENMSLCLRRCRWMERPFSL